MWPCRWLHSGGQRIGILFQEDQGQEREIDAECLLDTHVVYETGVKYICDLSLNTIHKMPTDMFNIVSVVLL